MIDHVVLRVSDYRKSKAFYQAALAPLGYEVVLEIEGSGTGFGMGGKPEFWVHQVESPHVQIHIAFASRNRTGVDAFHSAALEAGGKDNGAPGIREVKFTG